MRSFVILLAITFPSFAFSQVEVKTLVDVSVTIAVDGGTNGSGVVFRNRSASFVWTDAHVVSELQSVKTVVDATTGQPKVSVSYGDLKVYQVVTQNGRKVGEDWRLAKIIRYSQKEDIALLMVYQQGWPEKGTVFSTEMPKQGMSVWHVGSPHGPTGCSSVLPGTLSFIGRLRGESGHSDTANPIVMDQVAVNAAPGSSGGGVFCKKNGECLGLMVEYLAKGTHGQFCTTPTRRLREFSKRNNCLWAMDGTVPVPIEVNVITDDDVPLPKDFPGQPSSSTTEPAAFLPFVFQTFPFLKK